MDRLFSPRESTKYLTPDKNGARPSSIVKRDSLAAQLEQDPQLSTAKRAQRSEAFTSRMATKSLERKVLLAEEARAELENQLKEKDLVIQRLESERRWLAEREREEKEEKEKLQARWTKDKQTLERTVRTLRTDLTNTQAAHADLEDSSSDIQRDLASTINTQKSQITTLERQVALLQEELNRSREVIQHHKDAAKQWREQVEELEHEKEAPGRTSRSDDQESWSVIRNELHRQTSNLKSLETANIRLTAEVHSLRARNANIEILRQANEDLKQKAEKAQDAQERVIKLEAEVDAARKERERWAAFIANPLSPESSSSTPASITQALSSLRLNHANLLEEHGTLTSELKLRSAELTTTRERLEQAESQLAVAQSQLSDAEDQVRRHKRRVELSEMESNGLRTILDTYELEEKNHHQTSGDGDVSFSGKYDSQKSERILMLENMVDRLKATVDDLHVTLESKGSESLLPSRDLVESLEVGKMRIAELEDELANSLQSNDANLDKIEALEQNLWELGASIHAGNHVPPGTRVVQFKFNPIREDIDLKKETFDNLKEENNALLQRLNDLELGNGLVQPESRLVPRESWQNLAREKDELIKTAADKDKRLLRLKQVFTAKTDEFRETVSSILGYTLFFQPTKIRLTSTYDISAAITFAMNSKNRGEGTMKLLGVGNGGEGGPPKLNELIQYWIVERESIPCFMAALTLECFERMYGETQEARDNTSASMQLTGTL